MSDVVFVAPARYVTIEIGALVTGYSEKAIKRKIEDGIWLEGFEYVKAPDGRILIDLEGFERWARGARGVELNYAPTMSA